MGNRLIEQVGAANYVTTYNALNQISITTAPGSTRTNEWDAQDRLVAVNNANQRTEFTYDGESRVVAIRQSTNGVEASIRRFVWCDNQICEERNAAGAVAKRFFPQGVQVLTVNPQPSTLNYFYTRDHLGSIREMTDGSGIVRARYKYDPYGRRTKLSGDVEADFGFAGMFWVAEAGLAGTRFRNYDSELGRWLSRDPLRQAELQEGPNLYAYVQNNPVNATDPLGLAADSGCCEDEWERLEDLGKGIDLFSRLWQHKYDKCIRDIAKGRATMDDCDWISLTGRQTMKSLEREAWDAAGDYLKCKRKGCDEPTSCPTPAPTSPPSPIPSPPPNPLKPPPTCSRDWVTGRTVCSVHGF